MGTLTATILFIVWAVRANAQTPAQTAADPPSLPSVASLVLDLGTDIRNLPTLENALVLGIVGAGSLAVSSEDADLTRRFSEWAGDSWVFNIGDVAGELSVQFGTAVTVFTAGRLAKSRRMSILGADLVRAQILNTAVTHGVKAMVNRERPDGGEHSFPSGHASSTFATAAVLQRHLGWKAGLPAYALATFTGASRMAQNKHYLSDVAFGAAIGVVMGRTTTVGHGPVRLAVSPLAMPGGVGIRFIRLP